VEEMSNEENMSLLEEKSRECEQCPLSKSRKNIVFGEGPVSSRIMFIGEAPGAQEDKQGKPFVGNSGKLLNRLMEFVGLKREDIFITNVVKCRPPSNRNPSIIERSTCVKEFLRPQIGLIEPFVIVLVGRVALNSVLSCLNRKNAYITKVHGKPMHVGLLLSGRAVSLFPIIHPAGALRRPDLMRMFEEDMRSLRWELMKRRLV